MKWVSSKIRSAPLNNKVNIFETAAKGRRAISCFFIQEE